MKKKYVLTCKNCNKEFQSVFHTKKYCSELCKNQTKYITALLKNIK